MNRLLELNGHGAALLLAHGRNAAFKPKRDTLAMVINLTGASGAPTSRREDPPAAPRRNHNQSLTIYDNILSKEARGHRFLRTISPNFEIVVFNSSCALSMHASIIANTSSSRRGQDEVFR